MKKVKPKVTQAPQPAPKLKLSAPRPMPERNVLVQLTSCDEAGAPYCVRCDAVPAREASVVMGMLPGDVVQMGEDQGQPHPGLDRLPRMVEVYMKLVELGTAFAAPDGGLVRPAFWFDADKPRHELSVDGRRLPLADIAIMGSTILQLSGYGGGAATGVFPGANGA